MFKSVKRKAGKEKEKVDFKFEFHASQVPLRGWDKLLVSLIPLETGKVTVKTGKATVHNGSCQWTDPLLESAKFLQDNKAKDTDNGIYKFLVSTGSSRFGVLGETTINLAEHIGANQPTSLSLPLQNCNAGTILHVRIQCLNPKAAHRDLEDQRDVSPEPDGQSTGTDENAEFHSELSGNRVPDIPETEKQSDSSRDGSAALTLQYTSESLEVPPTPGENVTNESIGGFPSRDHTSSSSSASSYAGRHESSSGLTDANGSSMTESSQYSNSATSSPGVCAKPPKSGGNNTTLPAYPSKPSYDPNGRQAEDPSGMLKRSSQVNVSPGSLPLASERSPAKSHRRSNSLSPNFEAAETTFEELQREAASWEQHARKVSNEVEKLKQQLTAEIKHGSDMAIELSALMAERDSIKFEAEQLKSMKQASQDRETAQDKVHLEVEDARNAIKELRDELEYEKSLNLSLNLQLQKTQESNSELLLEIQDLDEALQKKDKEIEDFKAESLSTEEMGKNQTIEDVKATWMQKVQASEEEIRKLGEIIVCLQASERKGATADDDELKKTVELLKKELDELERDSQELTEENMNLLLQLKETNHRMNAKDNLISQLESKLKILSDQSQLSRTISGKNSDAVDLAEIEPDKLRAMVNDLTEKLRLSEESFQSQLASSRTLLDDLNSSAMALRSKNAQLEIQLKCSEDEGSLMRELNAMKTQIEEHQKERSLIASLKGQLKSLRGKTAKSAQEYANVLKRAEDLEFVNRNLEEETSQVIATLRQQLKSAEEKAHNTEEKYANVLKMMADIQEESTKVGEQMSSLLVAKETAEVSVTALDRLNAELQELLKHAEQNSSRAFHQAQEHEAENVKLLEKLSATGSQLKNMEGKLSQIEAIRGRLENRIQDTLEENRLNRFHIKELEFQLSALEEDIHSLNESRSAFETKAWNLELQNHELTEKLKIAVADSKEAREHADTLLTEIRALKAEMEFNTTISSMENHLSDLESMKELLQNQVKNLTEDKLQLEEKINEMEAKYRNVLEGEESARIQVQDVENEKTKLEAALKTVIKQQEGEIQQLQGELTEVQKEADHHKMVIWDLEMCIENMKHDIVSNKLSSSKLEEQLEKARDDCSTSAMKMTMLNDEVAMLQKEGGENEKKLLGEIQALVVSKQQHKTRADQAEEMLKMNQKEKANVIEQLQQEIQQLRAQMLLNADDKEMKAAQTLSESSQLRAEKKELEEKLWSMQETVIQANTDAFSLKENLEIKVEEAKKQVLDTGKKLEETLKELNDLKKEKTVCEQKVAELERKYVLVEDEKHRHAEVREQFRNRIQDSENLQTELRDSKTALHEMKLEKIMVEASLQKMNLDNARLVEELTNLKEKAKSSEEVVSRLKQSKAALEEKVLQFQELNPKGARRALEVEQRNELIRLRKQTTELKRKLLEQDEEKEDFRKKVFSLEEELQRKAGLLALAEKKIKEKEREEKVSNGGNHVSVIARSLSRANSKVGPMSSATPSRDAKDLADLRGKVKLLEDEVKIKSVELEASKYLFKEKEAELRSKIEHLELAKEHLVEEPSDSNVDQLQKELNRLQNQNAALSQRENELLSRLGSQEILQNELERFKEEKKQLENILSKFNEAAKGGNILERVEILETELAEALEANNMYKAQLQSAIDKQQNVHAAALENLGSMDQVMNDLAGLKRKNSYLEEELREMRDRYSRMSLQFAEVEAEREELVMAMRGLSNPKHS